MEAACGAEAPGLPRKRSKGLFVLAAPWSGKSHAVSRLESGVDDIVRRYGATVDADKILGDAGMFDRSDIQSDRWAMDAARLIIDQVDGGVSTVLSAHAHLVLLEQLRDAGMAIVYWRSDFEHIKGAVGRLRRAEHPAAHGMTTDEILEQAGEHLRACRRHVPDLVVAGTLQGAMTVTSAHNITSAITSCRESVSDLEIYPDCP